MQRRCQLGGVVFADVAWDPQRECLCTYELWSKGRWHLERELRGDDGEPRQVHEGDIKEIESRVRGKRETIDNWRSNLKDSREAAEKARKLWLRSLCWDTAKEMNRRATQRNYTSGGTNITWDDQYPCEHGSPQKATCDICREESRTTFFMGG
jgi:hypothetical protein